GVGRVLERGLFNGAAPAPRCRAAGAGADAPGDGGSASAHRALVSGGIVLAELERMFAGRAGGAHGDAARAVLGGVGRRFPDAGLAVTGSASRLAHRPDSDLDLVVANRAFARDAQFAGEQGGVRFAVVCLRPGITAEREQRWPLHAGGDAAVLAMIRTARVV